MKFHFSDSVKELGINGAYFVIDGMKNCKYAIEFDAIKNAYLNLLNADVVSSSSMTTDDGSSSSSNGGNSSPSGEQGNDIASYKTKKIGNQTWMAENLDYAVEGSKCYGDDPENCDKYGRLYDWATAMALPTSCNSSLCVLQINAKHRGVCPAGWHIPSDDEWKILMNSIGGSSMAGKHLKTTIGWGNNGGQNGNGLDTYGFTALPGGFGRSDGGFGHVGYTGRWWSSSEELSKSFLSSVRCVQD
jgi:uncharacterized protein (TIGR02145 family)